MGRSAAHDSGSVPLPGPGSTPTTVSVSVALAAPLLFLIALAGPLQAQTGGDGDWMDVEVATVGVDLATGAPLALVHEGWDEVLPIWIGDREAEAILRVLRRQPFPRPMTHDLMASILNTVGVELVEVRIHDLRDGTYIGSLHLRDSGREDLHEVDARPSDGLALAVRTGARIRVARRLLSGVPDVDFVSTERDRAITRIRGVTVAEPGREDRERWGLPDEPGVVVLHLATGMGTRGLRPGDLIVRVGGSPVDGALPFLNALRGGSDTSAVPLRVLRGGEEIEVEIPPRRQQGPIGE